MELENILKPTRSNIEIETMSPLIWAYVGDAIFELYIRTYLVNTTKQKPHYLHVEATKYVKAKAQAEMLKKLEDSLTEEEKGIIRRTRNTQNHHLPKHADLADYTYATAFEGLIGYLYLTGNNERLANILEKCI